MLQRSTNFVEGFIYRYP